MDPLHFWLAIGQVGSIAVAIFYAWRCNRDSAAMRSARKQYTDQTAADAARRLQSV